jgi:protein SFI1
MDAALKELSKLERLTADGKAKSPAIDRTLDALLATLRAEREKVQSGDASAETFEGLVTKVETLKKDLDERQKEIYNSISRYGKALDKVRPLPLRAPGSIGNGFIPHRNSPILYQPSTRYLLPPRHPRL